jgi:hypothetical protein|tara:strand:- start:1886 stop:2287 length:402 start_codon:yes stop_codon:yes gene_type:complete
MPTADSVFPSNYIKGTDIMDRQYLTEVAASKLVTMGQGRDAEDKVVIYFHGSDKGIVVGNQTNWKAMVRLSGQEDSDNWQGTKILVKTESTSYGSETFDHCIRIKHPKEALPTAINGVPGSHPDSSGDDDLPF